MIQSVKKAMDLLTVLSATPEVPIPLGELAERTNINKSTCAHIVDTLCESFYVERVSRKDGYRLGPWAYMLSRYGHYKNSLVNLSKPVLKWLHNNSDASVFISVICNGKKYIVYHIDSVNLLPMSDGNIIQGYLETTASGLLHMANMDKEALIHTLNRRKRAGETGITTITPQFLKFLNGIRTNGYCFYSPNDPTICSHAFAVNNGNKVVAALGIVYSSEKDSDSYHSKIYRLGHIAASELSRRLSQSQA